MNEHGKDPGESREDRDFHGRLRRAYDWPEPGEAERSAFRARLAERIENDRARRARLRPAWAACGVVALVVVAYLGFTASEPGVEPGAAPGTAQAVAAWEPEAAEDALLALTALGEESETSGALPADYQAIASVFLDGI